MIACHTLMKMIQKLLFILFVNISTSFHTNNDIEDIKFTRRREDSDLSIDFDTMISKSYGEGKLGNAPKNRPYLDFYTYGSMFDVIAKKTIAISELEVYATEGKNVSYQIYTVKGSYMHSRENLLLWRIVGIGVAEGRGLGDPTPIEMISPVIVAAEKYQGFYITLTTEDLAYTPTQSYERGDALVWNEDLIVDVGSAVSSYPLIGTFFEPRLLCGFLNYYIMQPPVTAQPSRVPVFIPSLSPSISVAPSFSPSYIPSLSLSPSSTPSTLEPSSLPTLTLHEISTNYIFIFNGYDLDYIDKVSEDFFTHLLEQYYETQLNQSYTGVEVNVEITDEYVIDNMIIEFEVEVTSMYRSPPEYALSVDTYLSTVQDFVSKKKNEIKSDLQSSNVTSYFHRINRMSFLQENDNYNDYENRIVNQTMSFQGPGIIEIMKGETKFYFETELSQFLNHSLFQINPTTHIVSVEVTHQNFHPPFNDTDALLTFWVTIVGKYVPQPSYDFKFLIQSTIDRENEIIIQKLRASRISIFESIHKIKSCHVCAEDVIQPLSPDFEEPSTVVDKIKNLKNNLIFAIPISFVLLFSLFFLPSLMKCCK